MLQAVAFDLDDTLLRDDRSISDYTVQALRRARSMGVHVIPASGRVQDSMRPYVEQLGCASCYISGNGAEVWDADHRKLMSRHLSTDLAREAVLFARSHGCYAQVYEGDTFYYDMVSEHSAAYARSTGLKSIRVPDLAAHIRMSTPKVLLIGAPDMIAALLPLAQQQFAGRMTATCSKPIYLEITPPDADKGNALSWTAVQLGFDLARTMAFGDSLNDLTMLTAAGHGVAMGNARNEVKQRLPHQCLSNNEDGVARYLNAYLDDLDQHAQEDDHDSGH